jgi:uridine kinase
MPSGLDGNRSAAFDEPSDAPGDVDPEPVCPGSVLIFDGLFLHRRELREYWDDSIFLTAPARIRRTAERCAIVESASGTEAFLHLCWWWSVARRYHEGWRLYVEAVNPGAIADSVLLDDELAEPTLTANQRPDLICDGP